MIGYQKMFGIPVKMQIQSYVQCKNKNLIGKNLKNYCY